MVQINRFHIFCFNLSAIFVLKPRMSCNYEISRLFPFSLSLLIPFQVGLLKKARLQLETLSLGIFEIIFHKNTGKMSGPIGMALLFGLVPRNFFYPPPMWWIVIRFGFLVSGQKHELWGKNVNYFNVSPIPLFYRFFAIHCFPAIFLPSRLTYESWCESFPSKNKLSGKNCAAAGLNFQQPEILKRFCAIWPFSFRLFSKLFPLNNFREFMLFPAGYARRKGNWSWLKA